jgi:ubiquinone biosynthesis protein UbiJ
MAFAKPKLRKAQFDCALGGNATMLIWLGKQYLGQIDKQEMKVDGGVQIVYGDKDDERL